jgi:hypothetical protein
MYKSTTVCTNTIKLQSHVLLSSEGKPIPTELRNEEAKLRDALAYDDEEHEGEVLV